MLDRRTMLRSLLSAAAVTSLSPKVFSQIAPATPPQIEQVLQQYMKKYSIPGMALAFVRGSQVLYSGVFGEADKSGHEPVQPDSLFRIASNSKAFTSAAIFLLIEQGRLGLQDKVFAPNGLLPEFSALGPHRDWIHAITVHQLLTHTAGGWGNENNDPMFEGPGLNHQQLIAHGGWIATALDLSRFLAAMFSPQDNEGSPALITMSSLTQMTQGTQANPGYACGLAVNPAGNAWHAGSLPGTTCLMVHTKSGMSWAATLNSRSADNAAEPDLDKLLWQIARSVPQWRA